MDESIEHVMADGRYVNVFAVDAGTENLLSDPETSVAGSLARQRERESSREIFVWSLL